MRIKMRKTLAGVDDTFRIGKTYEVENAFGEALCADGRAVPVDVGQKPKRQGGKRGGQKAEGASAGPAGGAESR